MASYPKEKTSSLYHSQDSFSYLSCFNIFKSQVLAGQISTVCLQIPISFRFQAFVQIPISLGKAQQGAQPALRDPSVMPICGIGAIGTICGIGIGCICICGAGAAALGVMDRPLGHSAPVCG
jgi:hypothetical protein